MTTLILSSYIHFCIKPLKKLILYGQTVVELWLKRDLKNYNSYYYYVCGRIVRNEIWRLLYTTISSFNVPILQTKLVRD